jgi:hypothetical protein
MRPDTFAFSGAECVVALCHLGFAVLRREPGRTLLRGAGSLVVVPDSLVLPAEAVDAIVREARVPYDALLRVLVDLPTQPDLPCVDAV